MGATHTTTMLKSDFNPYNYLIQREHGMRTYTMAELSRQTKKVCEDDEPALITSNGKPQSLIFNINGLPIDDAIDSLQLAWCKAWIREGQRSSTERGLDNMTLEDINEEIRQARLERDQQEAKCHA